MRRAPLTVFLSALLLGPFIPSGSAGAERSSLCPLALTVNTASPVGTGQCKGLRPGAYFRSPSTGCTLNFLFRGSDGRRYFGTAGHCLLADGQTSSLWRAGKGPKIRSDSGEVVGEGAYAIQDSRGDFALIRLNRGVKASAQMCHFGGPVALEEWFDAPATLEHYGQGTVVSGIAPGRTAVAIDSGDANSFEAVGVGNFGDSGSGVMHSGRAVGVLVALTAGGFGDMYVMRLLPQLEKAGDTLGIHLKLVTAPRL